LDPIADDPGPAQPVLVSTPGQKTIEEVSRFLAVPPSQQIKTLVYLTAQGPLLALVRGDHQLNETKLQSAVGSEVRPAHPAEIETALGASAGSLGPVGVSNLRILSDLALQGRRNLTCGANRDDYHLSSVTPGRDYPAEYFDLRLVQAGEPCVRCEKPLTVSKALEVGHIFKLGTRYSESLGANVLTSEGKPAPIVMGSYGIGIERILAAAIENSHDPDGICWPLAIAPFHCVISVLNAKEEALVRAAEEVYTELQNHALDVLFDDRDDRPGVKFKDADLIGIPYRINFGSKKFREGKVEWIERSTRKSEDLSIDEAIKKAKQLRCLETRRL
jgi:prolyl-tRNA synthetase